MSVSSHQCFFLATLASRGRMPKNKIEVTALFAKLNAMCVLESKMTYMPVLLVVAMDIAILVVYFLLHPTKQPVARCNHRMVW